MKLNQNSKEIFLDIVRQRQIEARRKDIADSATQSLKDYRAGKLKPESAKQLVYRLERL